jgi:HTH-type transcriptional repressor of NAD biosynthesis genes
LPRCTWVTDIPLNIRANWIRKIFPKAEVIEAWDGPSEKGHSDRIKRMHEKYILNLLKGRRVHKFYSSEFYGEHMSKALRAEDCRVDTERELFSVSGTEVRKNPWRWRRSLNSLVYQDLITKVVLLGAPSTGKTTLAQGLADYYKTTWMPEYGREYWEEHQKNKRLTLAQLNAIARGHREREEGRFLEANQYCFVDTNALTTRHFAQYYHGKSTPLLDNLADQCATRYDLTILCGDDIPYDDTWDRSGLTNRTVFQKQIRAELLTRRIPFVEIKGSGRQGQAIGALMRFSKWQSIGNELRTDD